MRGWDEIERDMLGDLTEKKKFKLLMEVLLDIRGLIAEVSEEVNNQGRE